MTIALDIQDKPLPPLAAQLIEEILDANPTHRSFMVSALEHINETEITLLETYLEFCREKNLDIGYLTDAYLTIVADTLREQVYFMKHKEYRHKSYADVAGDVYHNEDYMNLYMYGLAITDFLWPNHLEMSRFFKQTLPNDKKGHYLEIGPGHGYYLMTAMKQGSFDQFLGIDISEASIKQTDAIVNHFAPDLDNKFSLERKNFLEAKDLQDSSFDAIVMGEVLEHVEQPDVFLKRIATLAKPDAYIYVTTCINAPAIDHIYLWRTTDDLEQMIESCGLKIKTPLRLPYEGKTLQEAQDAALSINVAYVLEKE